MYDTNDTNDASDASERAAARREMVIDHVREALAGARRRIAELEAEVAASEAARDAVVDEHERALVRADQAEAEVARLRGSVHSLSVALAEVAEARFVAAQRQREEASR